MSFERMGRDKRFGCEPHRGFRASSVVYTKIKHWKFVRRIAFLAVVAVALGFGGSGALASSAEARVGVIKLDPSKTLVEFRLGGSIHDTHGKFQFKGGGHQTVPYPGQREGADCVRAAGWE